VTHRSNATERVLGRAILGVMAAATLQDMSEADAKHTWIAQELAKLPPEHRAQYDADAWFRGFVHTALEMEWRDPVGVAMEHKARETYGSDVVRERDDFDAGRHPFQKSR
jgi:hypothetical protein